jgi:CxxC motif-containing protein (DUF1111 family)
LTTQNCTFEASQRRLPRLAAALALLLVLCVPARGLGQDTALSGYMDFHYNNEQGSASTVEDAIRRHGGEAERARERFDWLGPNNAAALVRFLRSL